MARQTGRTRRARRRARPGWQLIAEAARRWRRPIAVAVVCGIAWTATKVSIGLLVKQAIDRGIETGDSAALRRWTILLGVMAVVSALFVGLRRYSAYRAGRGIEADLRDRMFAHLQRLHFGFHDRTQTGQLLSRANTDVEQVQLFLILVPITISNVLTVLAVTVILLTMDPLLTLLALGSLPLLNVLATRFSRRLHPYVMGIQRESAELAAVVEESVAGVRVIKGLGAEDVQAARLRQEADDVYTQALGAAGLRARFWPALELLPNLGLIAVLGYGGHRVLAGDLSLGALVAYNVYVGMLVWPLRMLGMIVAQAQRAEAAAERIHEVLFSEPAIVDPPHPVPLPAAGRSRDGGDDHQGIPQGEGDGDDGGHDTRSTVGAGHGDDGAGADDGVRSAAGDSHGDDGGHDTRSTVGDGHGDEGAGAGDGVRSAVGDGHGDDGDDAGHDRHGDGVGHRRDGLRSAAGDGDGDGADDRDGLDDGGGQGGGRGAGVGELRFEGVRFSYGDDGPVVLDGFDLVIPAGESVALVGATGSGKTTVARLIPRFYDVDEGRVLLDGVDVRDLRLRDLRRAVGLVFEDTFLFSDTVSANVAFADPDAPAEAIERAARLAGADDFVRRLEDGYATRIGERGYSLSGGQRQRLAIARAILSDPRVLILDDATSAVDPTKEHEIRASLARVMQGRTTIVIAHRPATIALADRVVLLDGGRVAATGTHEELLATEPRYGEILAMSGSALGSGRHGAHLAVAGDGSSWSPAAEGGLGEPDGDDGQDGQDGHMAGSAGDRRAGSVGGHATGGGHTAGDTSRPVSDGGGAAESEGAGAARSEAG